MTSTMRMVYGLLAAVGPMACAPDNAEPDLSAARGEKLYLQKCASCHGVDGKGGSAPDLTTLSAQNRGIFPRNFVMSVIDGFNRRDHPNSVMPEFGNEDLGPTVQVEDGGATTPTPSDLIALAAYLESIQR
ncbi:cytochrome c [uncultured Tateyamaria sp.]|uniref:c-type cytochrome n=1 Tax=uncultured Tateyamaria sp. TaxID=455651 RepID=UPI0026187992|nr:cytochrome c [uncultured Tateyamaria sp.]